MLRQAGWEQHDFSDPNAFAALYSGDDGASKAKVFAILNARYHEQEAYIIAQAGVPGAITIATNMAGRGTDIQLGGNADMRIRQELTDVEDPRERERDPRAAEIRAQVARLKEKALAAGGLFVLGTERHESRRIDNQLRGRSGRQGDPGHSKFFLSLEDDLMRIFGTDKLDTMLQRLGLKENEAIVHSWINKALEKAQQKVEARNFDIRKNLLKFDNVMNDQRKVIFDQRIEWMRDEAVHEIVADMRHAAVEDLVGKHVPENAYPEQWDTKGLREELKRVLDLDLPVDEWAKEEGIADEELLSRIERRADEHMASKVAQWGADVMRYVEKSILLQTLDHLWREHLVMLEHLRQVIGLRGYGQRDPLNEYKAESFNLFEAMSTSLREAVTVAVDAGRDQDGAAGGAAGEPALHGGAQDRSLDRRGRDGAGARRRGDARAARDHRRRGGRAQSERSDELGQGRPQRELPVRLRQEVQALPRPVRVRQATVGWANRLPFRCCVKIVRGDFAHAPAFAWTRLCLERDAWAKSRQRLPNSNSTAGDFAHPTDASVL